ncbi:tryptase [Amyelois transitella]|uniref:tryptase n=1 Tax=Amyelois transitella TaxID=680683 RepID=UPI0029900725|nr:tryptase [Amyelois transitella]
MLGQKLHCGGAIITDQHVLTAGHCITFGVHFHDLTVNIGMHDRLDTNEYSVLNVINGVKHPKFTSNAVRDINDIAVLTLSQKIKFSDRVMPICLPDEDMDFKKVPLTVAGWGKTRQGALTSSRYLLETKVTLVDFKKCSKSNIYRDNLVRDTMMCAYSLGKDACQGDSGGPLFATHDKTNNKKWYQVGIVSWGIDCAKPDYPECGRQKDILVSQRIVGGRRAQPHSFPWAIAILKNEKMHCGGALITNRHILSAGHCFKWDDSRLMKVLIGLDDLDKLDNVTTRSISKVVIHEKFTSTAVRDENDIAIATLNESVVFSPLIIPVCLPNIDEDFGDWAGIIVGWGRVGVEKASSRTLLMASLRILSDEKCVKSELAQHLKPTMMCAFSKGKDGCQGDSGGPLLVLRPDGRYLQAGIISWGIGCADPRYPGVYTKVSNYISWIHQHTSDGVSCP